VSRVDENGVFNNPLTAMIGNIPVAKENQDAFNKAIAIQNALPDAMRAGVITQSERDFYNELTNKILNRTNSAFSRTTGNVLQLNDESNALDEFLKKIGAQSSIPGFKRGGSFVVGGSGPPDSKVAKLRVSPGEEVTIRKKKSQSEIDKESSQSQPDITINFNVYANDADSFRRTEYQITRDLVSAINQVNRGKR
jgi:hypothetical protein